MPNGETVSQARRRIYTSSGSGMEARTLAMAMVADYRRAPHGMSIEEAEDLVYGVKFGIEKFPVVAPVVIPDLPSLADVMRRP